MGNAARMGHPRGEEVGVTEADSSCLAALARRNDRDPGCGLLFLRSWCKRSFAQNAQDFGRRLPRAKDARSRLLIASTLRIRRRAQQLTLLDALYRVGLDSGFLVAAKIDVEEDQQRLRAMGDRNSG